jgi:hypothetical protein
MNADQTNKYEEAAKEYAGSLHGKSGYLFYVNGFLAGATFAHNEQQGKIEAIDYRVEDHNKAEQENQKLREALKGLMTNPSIDLGDKVYDVRDSEGKGWEGPDVIAWGKAVEEARKLLEGGE